MRRRTCIIALGMIIIAGIAAVALRAKWLPFGAQWLDVGGELAPADVVLSLPGDDERRPFVASALVKVGLAKRAVVVKNAITPDESDGVVISADLVTRRIYEARGLQAEQIVLLSGESTSTADDLEALRTYLREHPQESACVVTNAYHTRRTRWTLRNRMPEEYQRVAVFSAPNPEFDSHDWWQTPEGLQCVLSEYLKLGWYFLRYGQGWVVILVGLVLLAISGKIWRKGGRETTNGH